MDPMRLVAYELFDDEYGYLGLKATVAEPPPVPLPPRLTDIHPASGIAGAMMRVALAGQRFAPGHTEVAITGSGITIPYVEARSETALECDFQIAPNAAKNPREVTVKTAAGTSNAVVFRVGRAKRR